MTFRIVVLALICLTLPGFGNAQNAAHHSSLNSHATQPLALVEIDGKWGFIDNQGKFAIPRSSILQKHSPSISADVRIGEQSQFIDGAGKTAFLIPPDFDLVLPFSEQRAAVLIDSKWGFIDQAGKIVIPPQFAEADSFSDRLARVALTENGNYGFIDRDGQITIQPQFEKHWPGPMGFSGRRAIVLFNESGEGYGYIDATGKTIIAPRFQRAYAFSK